MTDGLPARMAAALKAQGMTQKQLAAAAGITEAAVSHYIKGDRVPQGDTITRMAGALGVTPTYLLTGETAEDDTSIDGAIRTIERYSRILTYEQRMAIAAAIVGGPRETDTL